MDMTDIDISTSTKLKAFRPFFRFSKVCQPLYLQRRESSLQLIRSNALRLIVSIAESCRTYNLSVNLFSSNYQGLPSKDEDSDFG